MPNATALPVPARIRMHHLHRFGVPSVQSVAALDQRPSRIQADDLLQAKVEEVGEVAAHVRAQRVTDTGRAVNAQPRVAEKDETLCDAVGHRTQIVDGRYVARWLGQSAPIDDKHIVSTVGQVGWMGEGNGTTMVVRYGLLWVRLVTIVCGR